MNIEPLQSIMLAVAQARSVEAILAEIVNGLTRCTKAALVRIWLVEPSDVADVGGDSGSAGDGPRLPDDAQCLHLVASAGRSRQTGKEYSRLDGKFRRIPLGERKIGKVAATGEPFLIPEVTADQPWVSDPKWIKAEGVKSFAGQPLIFRGEVLGVLGFFDRAKMLPDDFKWLRTFADHAAVAIANARAFEEIERLKQRLEGENDYLQAEVKTALDFGDIIGRSSALQKVLRQIELVARTEASVLVLGESGTGKELIARAIHERSTRQKHPLIKVNCGAIPEELFESEFFGHVKGAFTGAVKDRVGRFELADGGTLFLDEVGEIPLSLQAKLLRVLQEQQFERIGDERTRTVNVRVVAATNRNLKREVAEGRFREDLFYRLSVFPVELPPLRERREDIPLLAEHFLKIAAVKMNIKSGHLTQGQVARLMDYDWPGNVRELQNVIERAVILSAGGPLQFERLQASGAAAPIKNRGREMGVMPLLTRGELKQRERESIRAALAQTGGKIFGPGGAAELLAMKGTTLASRIKALGLKRE